MMIVIDNYQAPKSWTIMKSGSNWTDYELVKEINHYKSLSNDVAFDNMQPCPAVPESLSVTLIFIWKIILLFISSPAQNVYIDGLK